MSKKNLCLKTLNFYNFLSVIALMMLLKIKKYYSYFHLNKWSAVNLFSSFLKPAFQNSKFGDTIHKIRYLN
jgi:hypothetical protein